MALQLLARVGPDHRADGVPLELRLGGIDAQAAALGPAVAEGLHQRATDLEHGRQLALGRFLASEDTLEPLVVQTLVAADK